MRGPLNLRTGRGVRSPGFSLPELLVVLAILGAGVAVAIPLTRTQVISSRIRTSAGQFATDLRMARMIAVTKRAAVSVTVAPDPANYYEYTDGAGKLRRVNLSTGVRLISSTSPIVFQVNGSIANPSSSVFEVDLKGSTIERWTVTATILGVPSITRERI